MKKRLISLLLCVGFLQSCTYFKNYYRYGEQAAYHLENQEYEMAVKKSIASLERNPGYHKSAEVLNQSYKSMVVQIENEYSEMPDETTTQKELRANHLEKIVRLNKRIVALENRGIQLSLQKVSFKEKAQQARDIALQAKFDDAERLAAIGTRENQIAAAKIFRELGNFQNASQRYLEVKKLATRKYLFIPTQNRTKYDISPDPAALFTEKIVSGLRQNSEFAEFNTLQRIELIPVTSTKPYGIQSPHDAVNYAKTIDPDADFVVYSYLLTINLAKPEISSKIVEHSKDKEISSTNVSGKTVKRKQKLTGKAKEYTRLLNSQTICQLVIVDMKTGQTIEDETVNGMHSQKDLWAVYYSGDEYPLKAYTYYVGRTNNPPKVLSNEARIRLSIDDLVVNSGRVFGTYNITSPDVRPAVEPTGLKLGVDPNKIKNKIK